MMIIDKYHRYFSELPTLFMSHVQHRSHARCPCDHENHDIP
jgi:hypothetical protein